MKQDIQIQKEFYEDRWADFTYINSLKLKRAIVILNGVYKTKIKNPKILDLGCGSGWLTAILGLLGPTIGVDLSECAISTARQKFPHVSFLSTNIMNWVYEGEKFDVVVSQEVIEHIDDQNNYIKKAYEIMKPGGFLILTTPNKIIFEAFPLEKQLDWSNQPIEKWLSLREIRAMVSKYLKVKSLTTIIPGYDPKGPLRYVNSYSIRKVWEKLGLLESYEKLCLSLGFGLHIFLVAQKDIEPKD